MSRRFKVKTVYGQDDPRCMEEVPPRRAFIHEHAHDADLDI